MKAITIRQPWAWAICRRGKRIENRSRDWKYRGEIAIHASKRPPLSYVRDSVDWMLDRGLSSWDDWPGIVDVPCGAIVAVAYLLRVVVNSESEWFTGPYGLELGDVRVLARPIPAKGALTLWTVPEDIERQVREQLR